MKATRLNLTLLTGLTFLHFRSEAQTPDPVLIGVESGILLARATVNGIEVPGEYLVPEVIPGFYAGISAEIPITQNLSFTTGAQYAEKGFSLAEGVTLDVFEIPVPIGVEVKNTLR